MAIPGAVQAQLNTLNLNVNTLVRDRARIEDLFNDDLGGSVYSLLTTANQGVAKTAIVNDMQAAVTSLQAVVTALAAM